MPDQYTHLGEYSDWVAEARNQHQLFSGLEPGPQTRAMIRENLGFSRQPELPQELRLERRWEKDGLTGEELSWSTGFGPRTHAWVLKPAGSTGKLPVVLGLHDHRGFKFIGKEKIAEGPEEPADFARGWWQVYGNRAWANALAREGYLVLVHDTFLWGSRRFSLEVMRSTLGEQAYADAERAAMLAPDLPKEVALYNNLAGAHEHIVSKYCNLLGTTLAGVVARDDRIALNYLLSREDANAERSACMGLSGGGNRAALLMATAERLTAGVVVGLMSTYAGLLDHNVSCHTWMFFPFLYSRQGDWPDLAGSRAPAPLLALYDEDDELFTLEGMRAADDRLKAIYTQAGHAGNYSGQFFPGPHKFDLEMQAAAFAWLKKHI